MCVVDFNKKRLMVMLKCILRTVEMPVETKMLFHKSSVRYGAVTDGTRHVESGTFVRQICRASLFVADFNSRKNCVFDFFNLNIF